MSFSCAFHFLWQMCETSLNPDTLFGSTEFAGNEILAHDTIMDQWLELASTGTSQ